MANDLTLVSPTYDSAGQKFGTACLSGGYGYLTSPITTAPFTVECWFKATSAPGALQVIFGQAVLFWIGMDTAGKLEFELGTSGSGSQTWISSSSYADGQWHHFELGVSTNVGALMAIDGNAVFTLTAQQVASATLNYTLSGAETGGGHGYLAVRSHGGEGNTYTFGGSVDEVAVWNLVKHFASFAVPTAAYTGAETGLTALWHLDSNGTNMAGTSQTPSTTTVLPNNPAIVYSPYAWSGGKTINAGAYFRVNFTGTTLELDFDTTGLTAPNPQIWVTIDGQPAQQFTVAATITPVMPAATAAWPVHTLEVVVKSTSSAGAVTRWFPQAAAVVLSAIKLATGGIVSSPSSHPRNVLIFGDDLTEGDLTVSATDVVGSDATLGWAYRQRYELGAEIGVIGFARQGLTQTGIGGVPVIGTSYSLLWPSQSRNFTPRPDLIVVSHGTNDSAASSLTVQTAMQSWLTSMLAAVPICPIAVMRPFNGAQATAIQAAINAISNPRLVYVDTAGVLDTNLSTDGVHPLGVASINSISADIGSRLNAILDNLTVTYRGGFKRTAVAVQSATMAVNTPSNALAGVAIPVSGTYTGTISSALDYSIDSRANWVVAPSPTVQGGAFSFTISAGLPAGTYNIIVRDHAAQSVSATSAATFTITGVTKAPNLTGVPTVVSVGPTVATFGWTSPAVDSTHDAATSFVYQTAAASSGPWNPGGSVAALNATLSGLTTGQTIWFRVQSVNAGGSSSFSTAVSATTVSSAFPTVGGAGPLVMYDITGGASMFTSLDASGLPLNAAGQTVGSIGDTSGNNHHLAQSNGAIRGITGSSVFGSSPALLVSGTQYYAPLETTWEDALRTGGLTVALLFTVNGGNQGNFFSISSGAGALYLGLSGSHIAYNSTAGGAAVAGTTFAYGSTNNILVTQTPGSGTGLISVNSSAETTGAMTMPSSLANMAIGGGGGANWDVAWGSCAIWVGAANTSERNAIRAWLTTRLGPPISNVPTGVTVGAIAQTSVSLSWTAPATDPNHNPASSYNGRYKRTTDSTWTIIPNVTASPLAITGILSGTSYDFAVQGINASGVSAWTSTVTATTLYYAPNPPTNISGSAQDSATLAFFWPAPTVDSSHSPPQTYSYQTGPSSSGPWGTAVSLPVNQNSVTITGLAASTTVFFRMQAVNNGGSSAFTQTSATTSATGTAAALDVPLRVNAMVSGSNAPSGDLVVTTHPFAKGQVPAGSIPVVYDSTGTIALPTQIDYVRRRASDGSVQFCKMAFNTSGATNNGALNAHRVKSVVGTANNTPAVTLAWIQANTNIFLKLYGLDFGSDEYRVSVNDVLANFPAEPNIGANPKGCYKVCRQGPLITELKITRYIKRVSDGATHKWIKVEIYMEFYAAGPWKVTDVRLTMPNSFAALSGATAGPSGPNPLAFYAEVWNGSALLLDRYGNKSACGGPNDPRASTMPASNMSSNGTIALPNGYLGGGSGAVFSVSGSGNVLPSDVVANAAYFPVWDQIANIWRLKELNRNNISAADGMAPQAWHLGEVFTASDQNKNKQYEYFTSPADSAIYQLLTSEGTCAVAPHVTTPVGQVTDGTIIWQRLTTPIGTGGSGSINVSPCLWLSQQHRINLKPADADGWWGTTAPTWLMACHDQNYLFTRSTYTVPYRMDDPGGIIPVANARKWYPGMPYFPGLSSSWEISATSDSTTDIRYGEMNRNEILTLMVPSHLPTYIECETVAFAYSDEQVAFVDEATGYTMAVNMGPNNSGGNYPHLGTTNPQWYLHQNFGTSQAGSPQWQFFNYSGAHGYNYTYGQVNNDGSHRPTPWQAPLLRTGREIFYDELIDSAQDAIMASPYRHPFCNGRNYSGVIYAVSRQFRCYKTQISLTQAEWVMDTNDPRYAYFKDCQDATAGYLAFLDTHVRVEQSAPMGANIGIWDTIYQTIPPWQWAIACTPIALEAWRGERAEYRTAAEFMSRFLMLWADENSGGHGYTADIFTVNVTRSGGSGVHLVDDFATVVDWQRWITLQYATLPQPATGGLNGVTGGMISSPLVSNNGPGCIDKILDCWATCAMAGLPGYKQAYDTLVARHGGYVATKNGVTSPQWFSGPQ